MENKLRKLASMQEWQIVYSRAKDCGLQIFNNPTDLTKLQVMFLALLEMYHGLYVDIAMGEKLMNYKRLQDPVLVDAYLTYKKEINKEKKTKKDTKKSTVNTTGIPTLVCRSPKRR